MSLTGSERPARMTCVGSVTFSYVTASIYPSGSTYPEHDIVVTAIYTFPQQAPVRGHQESLQSDLLRGRLRLQLCQGPPERQRRDVSVGRGSRLVQQALPGVALQVFSPERARGCVVYGDDVFKDGTKRRVR